MKKVLFTVAIALGVGFTACNRATATNAEETNHTESSLFSGNFKRVIASNKYVKKTISLSDFHRLVSQSNFDVEYRVDNKNPRIEIYAPDNVIDLLTHKVQNGTLTVAIKENVNIKFIGKEDRSRIVVYSSSLDNLVCAGSGDVDVRTALRTNDKMRIVVFGSGDVEFAELSAKALNVAATGSGDVSFRTIQGGNVSFAITGSGDLEADKTTADHLNVACTGSGDVDLKNTHTSVLLAKTSGSGDVELSGTAQSASYVTSGSGDISAVRVKAEEVKAFTDGSGDITCWALKALDAHCNGSGMVHYKGQPAITATGSQKDSVLPYSGKIDD